MAATKAPPLLVIYGVTAEALVTPEETIALATSALIKTSDGRVAQDIRRTLALPGMAGTCLSLMVAADGPHSGAKVQSVYPDNFRHDLPSHQGGVLLFDGDHGHPVALINAHAITGLRTPAASVAGLREIDADCVLRAKVFVDSMPMALTAASDLIDPLEAGLIEPSADIDDVLDRDRHPVKRPARTTRGKLRLQPMRFPQCLIGSDEDHRAYGVIALGDPRKTVRNARDRRPRHQVARMASGYRLRVGGQDSSALLRTNDTQKLPVAFAAS